MLTAVEWHSHLVGSSLHTAMQYALSWKRCMYLSLPWLLLYTDNFVCLVSNINGMLHQNIHAASSLVIYSSYQLPILDL